MDILLIRPTSGNDRFGLGPFFQVEPLGLEYVAAALRRVGARPAILDARFAGGLRRLPTRPRARLVGLSCMHAVEYDSTLTLARAARRAHPGAFVVVGGHAAAAYPAPLETPDIDAICLDDGEVVLPRLVEALAAGRDPGEVPGLRLRTGATFASTPAAGERTALDPGLAPARDLVDRYRNKYHCLLFRPVWLVETARGCPFRCSFCSVWSLYDRTFRERPVEAVVEDMARAGDAVFIVDDLFWNHPARSLELARALERAGIRKRWILVQSRTDIVGRHPDLLEAWRPLARDFDIFLGLEAPSDAGLDHLDKDTDTRATIEAAAVARALGYGVTGNFVVDPDWGEDEFRELWEFVGRHRLERAGYTILTPLPGTPLFHDHATLRRDLPWSSYDMHHVLWEPRLGARRFFELYAETWRRSILNLQGRKRWSDWARQVRPTQIPYLTRVLVRTQRMMRPEAYLAEHAPAPIASRAAREVEGAPGS
jgi:hopanoid C-3 methylase